MANFEYFAPGRLLKNCAGRRNTRFEPRARLELPVQGLEGLAPAALTQPSGSNRPPGAV